MTKKGKQKWFIRVRSSYLPCSWQGWLTYIPYIGYLVGIVVWVLRSHNGLLATIFIVVPNWITAFAIMQWLALRKS